MAPLVGRVPKQVAKYETGRVVPPADVLAKWARATGKPLAYFMPEAEEPEPEPEPEQPAYGLPQNHPGVEELAGDAALRRTLGVTDEDIEDLRTIYIPAHRIETVNDALEFLRAVRSLRSSRGDKK